MKYTIDSHWIYSHNYIDISMASHIICHYREIQFNLPSTIKNYKELDNMIAIYFGRNKIYYQSSGERYYTIMLNEYDFQEFTSENNTHLYIGLYAKNNAINVIERNIDIPSPPMVTSNIIVKAKPIHSGDAIKFEFCSKCKEIMSNLYSKLDCGHTAHTSCAVNPSLRCQYCQIIIPDPMVPIRMKKNK